MEQRRGHASAFEKTKVMIGMYLKDKGLPIICELPLGRLAELALSHLQLC
jgi:hypothetical protein